MKWPHETSLHWGSGGLWNMTNYRQVVTFIGAGGKTTCLQTLSQEVALAGQPVIATTTTKVFPERHMQAWKDSFVPPSTEKAAFWYAQAEAESGKWIGPSLKTVDRAIAADFPDRHVWVIEGDGARGRKLKCWASHEPQIPELTECAVLVLDRELWGNVLAADQVHRSECCRDLIGRIWNANQAWTYFLRSPVFKTDYENMDWVILLNSPGRIKESKLLAKDNSDLGDPLEKLYLRWEELREDNIRKDNNLRLLNPRRLRLAAGDAKEGDLRWFDLW